MADSVPTHHTELPPSISSRAAIWIAAVWAIFLCWAGRHEMLDDALIHLRYAAVLHDRHFISFDGIHPSYGASSLLYVGLLALLRSVTHSPLLPKAVSLAAYGGLLGLAYWISRINRLALALILVLVSPFAVRWLTDGMETSMACLFAVAFSILLYRKASPTALGAMALALSLLRVDLTLLVGFGVILTISRRDWLRAGSLCIGSGLSLAFIRLTMGYFLPDTAVAKQGLPFLDVLSVTTHEIVATSSFGLGAMLVWLLSTVLAWQADRRPAIICNLPFPTLVLLAALRGQQMHGVRYIIWALLFSIASNLVMTLAASRRYSVLLTVFGCALAIAWVIELPIALKVARGRAENLYAMEHGHLDKLHGEGLAGDVGFIGYFSAAPICDMYGLVNGRDAAQRTDAQRSQACLAAKPSFLFLTANQTRTLEDRYHFNSHADWLDCGSVEFTNVGSSDRHWLLVRRTDYPNGCPAHL